MKYLMILLFSLSAHAAKIEDLEVVEMTTGNDSKIEFQLHSRKSDPSAFFYVAFDKDDRKSVGQLTYILWKLVHPEQRKLDAEILNFSPYPPGSFYQSASVKFTRDLKRKPSSVKSKK